MSTIFGKFTHFLHAHMIIYRNLTQNITKGQKRVKKGQKRGKNTRYLEKYAKWVKKGVKIPGICKKYEITP